MANYFDIQPNREPYQCNVEVDMDWLNKASELPYSKTTVEAFSNYDDPVIEPISRHYLKTWRSDVKSIVFGFFAMCLVAFGGSLAIADKSGNLNDVRAHSLNVASRSLIVLAIAAAGGGYFVSKRMER